MSQHQAKAFLSFYFIVGVWNVPIYYSLKCKISKLDAQVLRRNREGIFLKKKTGAVLFDLLFAFDSHVYYSVPV